jgi:hypothetical protein
MDSLTDEIESILFIAREVMGESLARPGALLGGRELDQWSGERALLMRH